MSIVVRSARNLHTVLRQENRHKLHRYRTNACRNCSLKADAPRQALRARGFTRGGAEAARRKSARHATRRETSEHPFGTMKMPVSATHFVTKTLPKVATKMALCVLTYNLTRILNIVGVPALPEAIKG
jgi:hypothetical protein